MKRILLCSFFFSLLIGCAAPGESPEQMIAEAKALDAKWLDAYNNGDVEMASSTYWNSPEVISFPPGEMELRGWDAVKEGFVKDFSSPVRGKLEMTDANYRVAGDVVITWGKWRYTMTEPEMVIEGRYTDVKANRDGKMVFLMDHASIPMPPPSAGG